MSAAITPTSGHVRAARRGELGVVTLARPAALNALSLEMVREITATLLAWRDDAGVQAVLLQGEGRPGKPPAFCAGGDIRFFHDAALAGDARLEDFFTEEYALDHLIHVYGKPVIVLMDGITMGGGMGLAQGASFRVVTEHSRLAMPETNIGFFPDVAGGFFLSRCPGRMGEFLALTGHVLGAADAIEAGLADVYVPSDALAALVESLADQPIESAAHAGARVGARAQSAPAGEIGAHRALIDRHFARATLREIVESLEAEAHPFAGQAAAALHKRSPLMMAVSLEQVRRARDMDLADELRMERGMVRQCFQLRPGRASEAVEGIRALAVDKDQRPRWSPASIADVTPAQVGAFFESPWPTHAHPLRWLR